MHPYRLLPSASTNAHTCADPPFRACSGFSDDDRWSRFASNVLTVVVLGALMGVSGVGVARALTEGGRIDIAPTALAHIEKKPAKETKPASKPAPPTKSSLAPVRPWLGGTHDPKKLLERANALEALDLDMTVADVHMSSPDPLTAAQAVWPTTLLPVYTREGKPVSFELRSFPKDSPLQQAGFREGDQLLGIDGYSFNGTSIGDMDPLAVQKRGSAVVELARGDHHIVLSLHWRTR